MSCEYNPEKQTAKYDGEPCHHKATLSMAAYSQDFVDSMGRRKPTGFSEGNWHMCECCAALPQFKRRKKNRWRDEISDCKNT